VHSGARDWVAIVVLQGQHKQFFIADCIDNPIVPFANAIELFLAVERLHSMRTRSVAKGIKPFNDAFLKRFGNGLELSLSWRSEQEGGYHRKESESKS
jgi:hypothetical protein